LRILLDIRHRSILSGSVSYIYNMLPGLVQAPGGYEFLILHFENQLPGIDCETIALKPQSSGAQMIYDQVLLPKLIRRVGASVYHPLKYLGTAYPSCHQITTLHAITEPYRGDFPTRFTESLYWRHMGRRILRRSSRIIAVSAFIKEFLVAQLGTPAERVTVIPHGVDPRFRRHSEEAGNAGGDGSDYILTVGNIFPVKNFVMAVHVLAALRHEYPTLRLKMAGSTEHAYTGEVRQAAEAAGISNRVDFLGRVRPEDLVPLMNRGKLLLMPSLTEGCPVTLLEAMACGIPVIGSGRGGIPEIGADAIVLVDDPHDGPAWIDAARALLANPEASRQLSARELDRAAQFSWSRAVQETLQVYDSLVP
jgi:glycosyltransferase involved in cell wall biosynthesis